MRTLQLLASVGLLGVASQAWSQWGDVYAMSNGATENQITVLGRHADGTLAIKGTYSTGGQGSGLGTADPFDALGSQNSLLLSQDRHWLFAVDAGSNQVSVLRIDGDRLVLTDVVPSGGSYPASFAQRGDVLEVLNAGEGGNITGFRIGFDGHLQPIPGSTRLLHAVTPYVGSQPNSFYSPTQVQFTPDGEWLVVAIKNLAAFGTIQTFSVSRDGAVAQKPAITTDLDPLPFGFMFDRRGHLLVTEADTASMTSYDIEENGTVKPISALVKTGQIATCWVDGTDHYLYTSNTNANTLSSFALGKDGSLSLLEPSGVAADMGANHEPADVKVSGDQQFLYVGNTGAGTVATFRINPSNGQLTALGEVSVFPPLSGMEGLTAQ
jgi:6-phosphogluconolactonase